MNLKVYRYDDSLIGNVFRKLRSSDLPSLLGVESLAGKNLHFAIRDFFSDENMFVLSKEEINRFVNPLKNTWISGTQYYIRHPKEIRERYLIEAEQFHDYIFREQMSEIISFVRSAIQVKRIYISISLSEATNGQVYYKFNQEDMMPIDMPENMGIGIKVEGKVNVSKRNDYEIELACPEGLKVSERRKEYAWINDFPQLMESLDAYTGNGTFNYSQTIDNSFNLSIKLAEAIGISIGKLKKHTLKIEFN